MEYIAIYQNEQFYCTRLGGEDITLFPCMSKIIEQLPREKNIIYLKNLRTVKDKIFTQFVEMGYKPIRRKKDKKKKTIYIKENASGVVHEISIYIDSKTSVTMKNVDTILFTRDCKTVLEEIQETSDIINKLRSIGCNNTSLPSFGFSEWQKTIKLHYRYYFPLIDIKIDNDIRQAYNHGLFYIQRSVMGKKVTHGYSIDINSMYPYILANKPLPWGEPMRYTGQYEYDIIYPLYIQELYAVLRKKRGKIDYMEHNSLELLPIKHIIASNIELETLQRQYDIVPIEWVGGYKFKSIGHLFDKFIEKWYGIKVSANVSQKCFTGCDRVGEEVRSDPIMANFSKIVLNTLVGQFGRKPYTITKTPFLKKGVIEYKEKRRKTWSVYLPLAIFVVDYGRQMILDYAQSVKDYSLKKYHKDMYLYTDTDCIRTTLPLEDLQKIVPISPTELGKFKIEEEWDSAYFCGIKSYITKKKSKLDFHVSGLETHERDNWLQENGIKL